ncbi:MAG: tetratricopeptide repeat protein [Planctomycetes bacterium]|nr:tetratricopeptide repeat protein [Planctomycetota bacterium]
MSAAKVSGERAMVFAQAALKKGLVTREQAQECVRIARKLKKAKKPLPIETVFVRKGYLRKAEAAALVKRIRPKGSAPALDLVPETPQRRDRCSSCDKNPGDEADCYHCGADLESGGPGPRATVCESCSGVVLRGSAICFHCGQTMRSRRPRKQSGGSGALDRLIVLATVVGVGYFLIYKNLIAPTPPPQVAASLPSVPTDDPKLEAALTQAAALFKEGKRPEAVKLLEETVQAAAPEHQTRVQRTLALIAEGATAEKAARAALAVGEDPLLRRRLAELAWQKGDAKGAKTQVRKIPSAARGDTDWRLLAAVERKLGGAWEEALLELKKPLPAEKQPMAIALWRRGLDHLGVKRVEQALRDLERAVELDPKRATLHASLGAAYLQAKKPAEARIAYQAAIRTDPQPTSYVGLGLALEGLNERKSAIQSFESFLQMTAGVEKHAERRKQVVARLKRLREDPKKRP